MQRKARTLTGQEIHSIIKLLENRRDRAIFALGIYTGLRIGEIIALNAEQVFTPTDVKTILVIERRKVKNTVHSEIPMMPRLRQVLLEYRQDLVSKKEPMIEEDTQDAAVPGWLFPSGQSKLGHISRAFAHNMLSETFRALKLKGASTHSMRRTMLTTMTRAGVSLRTVKAISGHANIAQLQDYLEPRSGVEQRAVLSLNY